MDATHLRSTLLTAGFILPFVLLGLVVAAVVVPVVVREVVPVVVSEVVPAVVRAVTGS